MKFFMPEIEDPKRAEEVYEAIRKFVAETMGAKLGTDRRVFRINGAEGQKKRIKEFEARVGKPEPFEGSGEIVVAIFYDAQRDLYLVCTRSRGAQRGFPRLVGAGDLEGVEDFEP